MTTPPKPGDRRPIAARSWRFSQASAEWLARRGASPNGISTAGMAFGILGGAALAATALLPDVAPLFWLIGAACVQPRLLANMLDGMVAVSSGRTSPVGELFNEVPDRISDVATLVGLGYAVGGDPTLGYLAALAAVMTAYVRAAGKVAGAPNDFCGPMAKQQRMFTVTLTALLMTALPLVPAADRPTRLPAVALALLLAGSIVTIVRRLHRAGKALRAVR